MLHGSHPARDGREEQEHEDFWTDIPEGADMLPTGLPGDGEDALGPLDALNGLAPFAPAVEQGSLAMLGAMGPAANDPLGSWTGVPDEDGKDEEPTQDADDL